MRRVWNIQYRSSGTCTRNDPFYIQIFMKKVSTTKIIIWKSSSTCLFLKQKRNNYINVSLINVLTHRSMEYIYIYTIHILKTTTLHSQKLWKFFRHPERTTEHSTFGFYHCCCCCCSSYSFYITTVTTTIQHVLFIVSL